MDFLLAAATDVGISKTTNQDSFSARIVDLPNGSKAAFAVLCDGMGGLEKGELASASVVNAFNQWAITKLPWLVENGGISDSIIAKEWTDIAVEFNEKLKKYGKSCAVRLGTTLTALLVTAERRYIINVGDSRAYEIYDRVSVLTNDQTVVAKEVELGHLTPQQAKTDPRRSVLLQCIGASDYVYPDMFFGATAPNSVYMLCSDGFRHEITEDEIYMYFNPSVMTSTEQMKANSNALIAVNKQRGEKDNISVVTIRTF